MDELNNLIQNITQEQQKKIIEDIYKQVGKELGENSPLPCDLQNHQIGIGTVNLIPDKYLYIIEMRSCFTCNNKNCASERIALKLPTTGCDKWKERQNEIKN